MRATDGGSVVVSVARGHTNEQRWVFTAGEASPLSVGARGDWRVSGPGVMPVHLWLSFDGRQLFAASGEGTAHLQGRALGTEPTPVRAGDELRFGFALLRVAEDEAPTAHAQGGAARSRRAVRWAAGGLLMTLALGGFLAVSRGGAPPEPSSRAPVAALPALPTNDARVGGEPERAAAPPGLHAKTEPLALLPAPQSAEPLALPLRKPQAAFAQNVANRPIPRLGEQPWLISEAWRAQHERQLRLGHRTTAKLIFLGDSITEGWGVAPSYRAQLAPHSPLNLGIAGDTTQNVLWRLSHGALDGTQPRLVVLMLGVNNLAGGFTPEATADGVRAVLSATQSRLPDVPVLLLAVLPARREASSPLREQIRQANRLIASLASPGRVEFLDVGAALLEPDGSISKSVMRDFLHPTAEGFEKLTRAVAPRIEALLGDAGLPAGAQ